VSCLAHMGAFGLSYLSPQFYQPAGATEPRNRVRILIADAHPLLRYGLAALLSHYAEMDVCALAGSGCEAVEMFRQYQPEVVLIDMRLMSMNGGTATQAMRELSPKACIIAMTTVPEKLPLTRAFSDGAAGCWLKTSPLTDLVALIRAIDAAQERGAPNATHKTRYLGSEPLT